MRKTRTDLLSIGKFGSCKITGPPRRCDAVGYPSAFSPLRRLNTRARLRRSKLGAGTSQPGFTTSASRLEDSQWDENRCIGMRSADQLSRSDDFLLVTSFE